MKFFFLSILAFCVAGLSAQIKLIPSPVKVSLRGLAVLNDSVWWVSGRNNTVAKTEDLGQTWSVFSVGDTSLNTDYRDIELLSKNEAVIMGITRPAVIYRTADAGKTWTRSFETADTNVFIDAMDFWSDGSGICLADPINGKWPLLFSKDRGKTWAWTDKRFWLDAGPKEAAFAAGGMVIRCFGKRDVVISTGGEGKARFYVSHDKGKNWEVFTSDVNGSSSSGLFAAEEISKGRYISVGGDFNAPEKKTDNIAFFPINTIGANAPGGYRCAIRKVDSNTLIATGDGGTDISFNQGLVWENLSQEGFFTLDCSSNYCVFTGKGGKIGLMKTSPGQ